MDRWMDERWMDGWMDEPIGGLMNRWRVD